MRIANFRWPIADLALKKENLKFKLANRKSKYYLLPYCNPKSTETQLCGHNIYQVYLYQITYLPVKNNLWLNGELVLRGYLNFWQNLTLARAWGMQKLGVLLGFYQVRKMWPHVANWTFNPWVIKELSICGKEDTWIFVWIELAGGSFFFNRSTDNQSVCHFMIWEHRLLNPKIVKYFQKIFIFRQEFEAWCFHHSSNLTSLVKDWRHEFIHEHWYSTASRLPIMRTKDDNISFITGQ